MNNQETLEGIIIKTINYKENSKIIYLVTKNGLDSIEVKGANKINGHSHIYANLLSKISYTKNKHYFQSGKVLDNYTSIRLDISKLECVLKIFELTYALINHFTDFSVFYIFLDEILNLINKNDDYNYYTSIFYIKSLYLLGIAPTLNHCTKCGNTKNLKGFVFNNGGMICKDCISINDTLIDTSITENLIKMYYIKLDELINIKDSFNDINYSMLFSFLDRYYETYIGYISKSSKIINKINE